MSFLFMHLWLLTHGSIIMDDFQGCCQRLLPHSSLGGQKSYWNFIDVYKRTSNVCLLPYELPRYDHVCDVEVVPQGVHCVVWI